jgi:hypothetical protein
MGASLVDLHCSGSSVGGVVAAVVVFLVVVVCFFLVVWFCLLLLLLLPYESVYVCPRNCCPGKEPDM